MQGYLERLKKYASHIEICGEARNSYSKTDHDATFMRIKRDYMGNDQLLPAYNMQAAICDEYIAVVDAKYHNNPYRVNNFRRGKKAVILEFTLISCGFNLYKYHNKKQRLLKSA